LSCYGFQAAAASFPLSEGDAYFEVSPPHTYERTPPNLFNAISSEAETLRQLYRHFAEDRACCPGEGSVSLDSCYIYEGQYVVNKELNWLAPSVTDYHVRNEVLPVLRRVISGNYQGALDQSADCTYVVLAKAGCANFGHFLTDVAPKIINLSKIKARTFRILWPQDAMRYSHIVLALCGHLGINADLVVAKAEQLVSARDVLCFTSVAEHDRRKSVTLLDLRDVLLSLCRVQMHGSRKIFIERGQKGHRRLSNQEQVWSLFKSLGFEAVYPAALPFHEQVRLFAQASHIAGTLGAGMANAIFARPGAELLMIAPAILDLYFWDLACLCKHVFHWHFTQDITHWQWADSLADYEADLPQLQATLSRVRWASSS